MILFFVGRISYGIWQIRLKNRREKWKIFRVFIVLAKGEWAPHIWYQSGHKMAQLMNIEHKWANSHKILHVRLIKSNNKKNTYYYYKPPTIYTARVQYFLEDCRFDMIIVALNSIFCTFFRCAHSKPFHKSHNWKMNKSYMQKEEEVS